MEMQEVYSKNFNNFCGSCSEGIIAGTCVHYLCKISAAITNAPISLAEKYAKLSKLGEIRLCVVENFSKAMHTSPYKFFNKLLSFKARKIKYCHIKQPHICQL